VGGEKAHLHPDDGNSQIFGLDAMLGRWWREQLRTSYQNGDRNGLGHSKIMDFHVFHGFYVFHGFSNDFFLVCSHDFFLLIFMVYLFGNGNCNGTSVTGVTMIDQRWSSGSPNRNSGEKLWQYRTDMPVPWLAEVAMDVGRGTQINKVQKSLKSRSWWPCRIMISAVQLRRASVRQLTKANKMSSTRHTSCGWCHFYSYLSLRGINDDRYTRRYKIVDGQWSTWPNLE
jgi:hypothetical protein